MAIEWTPDLSVGVELIDEQHKIWFEKANGLFEAGKERKAREYINTMIDFLDDYTKQHFKDEEAYMEKFVTLRLRHRRKRMQALSMILQNLRAIITSPAAIFLLLLTPIKWSLIG